MPVVGAVHSIRLGHSHPDKTFIGRIEPGFDFLGYGNSRIGLWCGPFGSERGKRLMHGRDDTRKFSSRHRIVATWAATIAFVCWSSSELCSFCDMASPLFRKSAGFT
jgi:hypothetical protein